MLGRKEVSIASYTYNSMQKTYILKYAKIPWFKLENPNHMIIVELSKKASRLPRGWRSRTIPAH
jgi:hypothetical protein